MAGLTSAVSWFEGGNNHLRVYTCKGNEIAEQCWDGSGWYKGAFSGAGSTVGATGWVSGGQIFLRVYAAVGGKIVESCWDKDRWYTGAFQAQGNNASATSWTDNQGALHIRVYVEANDGAVSEQCWDGSGPWYVGAYRGSV